MPNPNGGNLTENLTYAWADGDVYEIVQGDTAEGAAPGASFSGLGVDNEPHQILLNKIKYVRTKQVADEGNIAGLQFFQSLFGGKMGPSGYIRIPFFDVNLGSIVLIAQWGYYSWLNLAASDVENALFTFGWPIAFPNACQMVLASLTSISTTGAGGLEQAALNLEPVGPPYGKTQGQVFSDYNNQSGAVITIVNTAGRAGLTGFTWFSIGY